MALQRWVGVGTIGLAILLAMVLSAVAGDKVLVGTPTRQPVKPGDNPVRHRCLTPDRSDRQSFSEQLGLTVQRQSPWSLPQQALREDQQATIRVLVMRYNFQYETTDDPNTTGRGRMNYSNPLANPTDSAAYYDSVGHWIDPPPHNKEYFDAHMRALNYYWNWVSEGHIELEWDIYPTVSDSAFTLPHPMSYYGRCDSVVIGLEHYFIDAIQFADTIHLIDPAMPDLDFSQYDAIIIVHAGSDRQNDIGFPPTCSDLFTGFIKFGDSIAVDNGAVYVRTALMMPETASQDNRATALNAVMAHEFGHELGLVDLYRTDNFMSQLGDFSLMDNNGFSTGIDYGFTTGQVFGAIPIFPDAWSRAYLGYVPVVDFRQGSDIRVVAAEVVSSGIKIARVPISENEYYLIENRVQETDEIETAARLDSVSNVILGPVNFFTREISGEYDFLIPGSGMLIYLVDEGVAVLDYDGDGVSNFDDNDLQNDPNRKFVTLIEADGLINFGGFYRSGYGRPEDMFREDRQHSFTPNTNPPAIDNSGNNTHVFVTNITRDSVQPPGARDPEYLDTVMLFDLETDKLASGFPARVGSPFYPISPIVADLNADGNDEIITVADNRVLVASSEGENFLLDVADTCAACPRAIDSAIASVHPGRLYEVPLYYQDSRTITAAPVAGRMGLGDTLLVAVAVAAGAVGEVRLLAPYDLDNNGQADTYGLPFTPTSTVLAMSFGDVLWVLAEDGTVYSKSAVDADATLATDLDHDTYHGVARIGERLVVLGGNEETTAVVLIDGSAVLSYSLDGSYVWGPVVLDIDRDGQSEVIAATTDGSLAYVTVDTSGPTPALSLLSETETGFEFTTNPIVGDVDLDGYGDVIIGGQNAIYAFGKRGLLKTDFPLQVDDRFPNDSVAFSPIQAEISDGGVPELIFPTQVGNLYSYGLDETYGFPISAGELGIGSPVVFRDTAGARLAYVGLDGWLYGWNVVTDTNKNFWPMYGHDASGSFALPISKLGTPGGQSQNFREEQFYNYPNPVTDGRTAFRYSLGNDASSVTITVYDLSGAKIADLQGTSFQGDNELQWSCGDLTPGVYRCRIQVDFGGDTKTAFTDVAIIR